LKIHRQDCQNNPLSSDLHPYINIPNFNNKSGKIKIKKNKNDSASLTVALYKDATANDVFPFFYFLVNFKKNNLGH
jgi:hypothetical protein